MTIDITTLRLGDEVTTTHGATGHVCYLVTGDGFYTVGVTAPSGAFYMECDHNGEPRSHGGSGILDVRQRSEVGLAPFAATLQPDTIPPTVTVPLGHLIRLLSECNRLIRRHSWDKTDTMSGLVEAVDALTAEIRR